MSDTLTIKAKLDIIDWHISHGGGHKSRTARHFSQVLQRDIQANRVGERLMAEESIRQKAEQAKHRPDAKMVRQPKTGAAVAVLDTWIEAATEAKLILSSELICVRYQAICNELGISLAERAVMSKSWLQGRKNTHGIIASFKLQFKRQQLQRAVDLFEMNTPGHLCYKADVHQGMDMGREAFNAVGQRTMANCWRKAGFLGVRDEEGEYLGSSFDEDIELEDLREEDAETLGLEITEAQLDYNRALRRAEEIHLMKPTNRLSLSDLLNPDDEHDTAHNHLSSLSIEELVELCQDEAKLEVITMDDNSDQEEEEVSFERRIDGLQVALDMLRKRDEPFALTAASYLKDILRETRLERQDSLRDGDISNYFSVKSN
ncbi:MAG: hypothetical protein TREMPRED_005662 [Tremellales sp. Tagirdzhanova-0007]|nr:MAG: hypothetical protein TREMPRED_005662 [Tremellales sp. Tagirdzhanova-0007]